MLLLWSLGAGLFLTMFVLPIYALAWTGVIVFLGFWIVLVNRENPKVREQLLRWSIAQQFPWQTLSDPSLRTTVKKSAEVIVEVASRVYGMGRAVKEPAELDRILAAATGLLSLQYELARTAEDLAYGLNIIAPDSPIGAELMAEAPTSPPGTVVDTVCTFGAVQEEVEQAQAMAADIGQQLEILMLRLFQLEKLPNHRHGAAELAREIQAALDRAKAKSSALHRTTPTLEDSGVPAEFKGRREFLQRGFSSNDSTQGVKALRQLTYEYTQLRLVLERRKEDQPMLVAPIPDLAGESYRQGLSVLENALELVQAIRSSDGERLEREVIRLEREIDALRKKGTQATRLRVREETLASHKELLSLLEQQAWRVEELLHLAGRCEASLSRARIQLLSLNADGCQPGVDAVTETLSRVIQQAKEVQEELRELGF